MHYSEVYWTEVFSKRMAAAVKFRCHKSDVFTFRALCFFQGRCRMQIRTSWIYILFLIFSLDILIEIHETFPNRGVKSQLML